MALSHVAGVEAGLAVLDELDSGRLAGFPSYHAVRADLLARAGRTNDAKAAYAALMALHPAPAERLWLERKIAALTGPQAVRP
jgi:RNA polymerase sigma-70 factor (ECF subfamily)